MTITKPSILTAINIICYLLISGCASMPPEAKVEERISVTFDRSNDPAVNFYFYADDYDCFSPRAIPLPYTEMTGEYSIPRKRYLTIYAAHENSPIPGLPLYRSQCAEVETVLIEDIKELRIVTGVGANDCDTEYSAKGKDNQWRTLDSVERSNPHLPFWTFETQGPYCIAKPQFQGSSLYTKPRTKADNDKVY